MVFLFVAVFGPWLAPYAPSDEEPLQYVGENPMTSPEPPSKEHWFGKDPRGRDVFSLMLHGLKYTLFFVVTVSLLRVGIGGWTGIWLGMRRPLDEVEKPAGTKGHFRISSGLFGGIPGVVILVLLLSTFSQTLPFREVLLIQGTVLILFGLPPVIASIRTRTEELKRRLSVQAALVMGATRGWLIRKHIYPMLKDTFVILLVQDMIVVLGVLGQLSLFRIFLGGTDIAQEKERIEYWSRSLEWTGLMGQYRDWMIVHPYLVWVPLIAYVALLLVFHLLSVGLERRFRQDHQRHPYL